MPFLQVYSCVAAGCAHALDSPAFAARRNRNVCIAHPHCKAVATMLHLDEMGVEKAIPRRPQCPLLFYGGCRVHAELVQATQAAKNSLFPVHPHAISHTRPIFPTKSLNYRIFLMIDSRRLARSSKSSRQSWRIRFISCAALLANSLRPPPGVWIILYFPANLSK